MSRQSRSATSYLSRFAVAVGLYCVATIGLLPLARSQSPGSLPAYLLAASPVLGVAVGVWALWRYLNEADEFQTRKLLNSLGFSVAGLVMVTVAMGFCQSVGAPLLSWVWIAPLWAVLFALGTAWTAWRFR